MIDLGTRYDYVMRKAEELDVDLGGLNTQVYVVDFIAEICLDIDGLSMERATEGVLMAMKEMDIKPYQLSFMRESTEIFKYI